MLAILLLAFLGLLQQSQRVQSQSVPSVALPLAFRSPYLNCWLVHVNSDNPNATQPFERMTSSDLSQVCPFSGSNSTLHLLSLRLC